MLATNVDVYQDRHITLKITTKNPITKVVANIAGAALVFQIKISLDKNAAVLVERKNSAAGGDASEIEDSDLGNGEYKVHLLPEHVADIGKFFCETKMTLTLKEATIFQKRFNVVPVVID
jgi:hypothetical protein